MQYMRFLISATVMLFVAACSNEEGQSFVSEAQAAPVTIAQSDYGWRTAPSYPVAQAKVSEYY